MKKVASYIIIAALALSFGGSLVKASEVSGTISTDGTSSSNNGNPTPSPTPTPTPDPDDTGHSSEIGGDLSSNSGSNGVSGNVTGGVNINAPLDPDFLPGGRLTPEGRAAAAAAQTAEATTTATSSPSISDEEMARLALLQFGPRYGVPGAPFAGGPSGGAGTDLSVSSNPEPEITLSDVGENQNPFVAYVPRAPDTGAGDANLVAAAITNASGLSMPQLVLVALLGLILLGSMGYAISQAGSTARRPLA